MKIIIFIIGLFALIINFVIGVIFPSYNQFNMYLISAIIGVQTLLLLAVLIINLKDAFRISLSYIYSIIYITMLILGFITVPRFENNILLLLMFATVLVEILILIITSYTSNKVK